MKLLFIIICVKINNAGPPAQIFVMVICRGNMLWLLALGICRGYLTWVCFVYLSKSFCVSKSLSFVNKEIKKNIGNTEKFT